MFWLYLLSYALRAKVSTFLKLILLEKWHLVINSNNANGFIWRVGIFPSLGRIIWYHHEYLTHSWALSPVFGFGLKVTLKDAYHVLLLKQLVKSMGTDVIIMVNNNTGPFYGILIINEYMSSGFKRNKNCILTDLSPLFLWECMVLQLKKLCTGGPVLIVATNLHIPQCNRTRQRIYCKSG